MAVLPLLTDDNRDFWQSGAAGELRIARCLSCLRWIHPPSPVCPYCDSGEVRPEPVSGRGTLFSYTENHQPWTGMPRTPYVIALVELAEQPGLILMTRLVGLTEPDLTIGMPLRVRFEHVEDVWLPLFEAGER
jgi:uncharacterized protein